MSRIDDVCWCPTQFQELVPGTDYRVHIVGDKVFASEIASEAVDYRYARRQGHGMTIRATRIPDEVAQRCAAASREIGLAVSGVDLRRTAEGMVLFRDKPFARVHLLPECHGATHSRSGGPAPDERGSQFARSPQPWRVMEMPQPLPLRLHDLFSPAECDDLCN